MNTHLSEHLAELQRLHDTLVTLLEKNPAWAQEHSDLVDVCARALRLASVGLAEVARFHWIQHNAEIGCANRNGIFLNIPGRWLRYEIDSYPKVANPH